VLDKVTIAYRGATHEIGRGRDYFGIWSVDGSRSQPLEWWPETQEGWSAAWTRFAVLEAPDAITSVGRNATRPAERTGAGVVSATAAGRRGALAAALLLGVGVILGIVGLFPDYLGGTSLAAQPEWLEWSSLEGQDTETRLSQLCLWVLESEAAQRVYGLRIPGKEIAPARGAAHRFACLRALAVYGMAEPR